ncbi:MAG: CoA transferase [Candidatus Tectomicrobia bacterium]|uniref:CoA transferase n=1 Tax=Tectimicrobiota bacterium TaxID=2528274 RepID=A0A937VYY6_UNCTE|nr:CoA transferase [Candidatus Tectomicrobia bacterium]
MLGLLDDVRVLELTHSLSGAFCAKLLADQGAQTLKIESPGRGDAARYEPPFLGGTPHPEHSALFLAFNTNKRSVTLDIHTPTGQQLLLRLLSTCDVVIDSFLPGTLEDLGLGYATLQQAHPGVILTSITPFGQTGPYRHYRSNDLIAQAMGGFLYTTGQTQRPPMGTALYQMEIVTARNAVIAVMGALLQQRLSGEGQHLDISMMEAVVSTPPNFIHQYSFTGEVAGRGFGDQTVMDGMHLATSDREVTLTTAGTGGNPMEVWAAFLEEPRLLDAKFSTRQGRAQHWQELLDVLQAKLAHWKAHEFMHAAMAQRLVVGVVQTPEEVVHCPHLEARGTFVTLDHPEVGPLQYAGPGFLADGVNPAAGGQAAPRLGEHNVAVYCDTLGLSQAELAALYAAGVV